MKRRYHIDIDIEDGALDDLAAPIVTSGLPADRDRAETLGRELVALLELDYGGDACELVACEEVSVPS